MMIFHFDCIISTLYNSHSQLALSVATYRWSQHGSVVTMLIRTLGCQYHRGEKLRVVMVVAIVSLKGRWLVDCLSWYIIPAQSGIVWCWGQEPVREFRKWGFWLGYPISVKYALLVFVGVVRSIDINLYPDCIRRIKEKKEQALSVWYSQAHFLIWRGILLRSPRLYNVPPARTIVPTICGRIKKVMCTRDT